jgi:hypothetical protein
MKRRLSFSVLAPATLSMPAILGCILGCASSGTPTPTPDPGTVTSRSMAINGVVVETNDVASGQQIVVRGTPGAAMTALAQIYADMKIPIATMSPATGQIGNLSLPVPNHRLNGKSLSTYVNCGQEAMSGSRADLGDVTVSIISRAVASGDTASVVTTDVKGWARPVGTSSNIVPCETTGALEHDINVKLAVARASGS